jgi:enamine deaminase RidA (YjgF/YER057c/UK114 family)
VKKFLMLNYGYMEPTPEVMGAWMAWFAKVGDHIVDSGNPLGNCVEVTKTGSRELTPEMGAATGYSILSADTREEAEALLEGCPIIASVQLYEAMPM